ncbi:hypothetical protein EHI8A_078940 [Entamoeba histolytica HM-1:IMSS-B]|uniref:Uncharacterized protein n=6 Tax=Entamoeba histolytica TaxID=5759 RepID=C4LT75_ENTH1|nr:hypothetical protein EHI_044530 [Entamoeba histolytica HM-1:IMSS]EMD46335.1 Hypothetical protein EHI5A_088520 [Entamoeba histolytica KU27]EMH76330.1 hypothetical protein EHI8A_078940 [Entamoeba histolytica HM-1:IMSS-B]EMS13804.1 hypothetical protein KM1_104690 [Entamoeba histolytica HM-3:IMSS]ENY61675.1 hypothetical protein EHI7A_054480 [Entamoeba histolytica HM-1:IMSS-A]GAT91750.1 hypothetical protein CL6EHI_044530 [Entamoeba histolytica]|eukprot:XP_657243.1 hypothetical protein EHI_044530 [Entamoeba histolytica HM-1:IMSS]
MSDNPIPYTSTYSTSYNPYSTRGSERTLSNSSIITSKYPEPQNYVYNYGKPAEVLPPSSTQFPCVYHIPTYREVPPLFYQLPNYHERSRSRSRGRNYSDRRRHSSHSRRNSRRRNRSHKSRSRSHERLRDRSRERSRDRRR